jgi:hypothetical protein
LLENVLIGVDSKTLLLSQRVSRNFQAVVLGSTKLQKKLFFRSAALEEAAELDMFDDGALLLMKCDELNQVVVRAVWNHLLGRPPIYRTALNLPINRKISSGPEGMFTTSGSFERMHICHPPLDMVRYQAAFHTKIGDYSPATKVVSSTGERLAGRILSNAKLNALKPGSKYFMTSVTFAFERDCMEIVREDEFENRRARLEGFKAGRVQGKAEAINTTADVMADGILAV